MYTFIICSDCHRVAISSCVSDMSSWFHHSATTSDIWYNTIYIHTYFDHLFCYLWFFCCWVRIFCCYLYHIYLQHVQTDMYQSNVYLCHATSQEMNSDRSSTKGCLDIYSYLSVRYCQLFNICSAHFYFLSREEDLSHFVRCWHGLSFVMIYCRDKTLTFFPYLIYWLTIITRVHMHIRYEWTLHVSHGSAYPRTQMMHIFHMSTWFFFQFFSGVLRSNLQQR